MSCSNPMLAVSKGCVNPETGKEAYIFLRSVKNWLKDHPAAEDQLRENGSVFTLSGDLEDGVIQGEPLANSFTGEFVGFQYYRKAKILPCGQCLECRTAHAAEWANRILLEAKYHESSYFVTLTYDEEHVPLSVTKDGVTVLTLNPRDLQLFVKALRRRQSYHHDNQIRFYAVGEYGSRYHRPHYHLIIFGLQLEDLHEVGRNSQGRMLHDSDVINKVWDRGITEVEPMTWEAAAYCARYTVKKLGKAETDFYETFGLVPEFSRMSNRPGIGAAYLDDHMEEIYSNDEIFLSTGTGGRKFKPPRYYDEKFDNVYPGRMAEIKGNRSDIAENQIMLKLQNYSGSYIELLNSQHENFKNKVKTLRRSLE